jgi:hypothetical protein
VSDEIAVRASVTPMDLIDRAQQSNASIEQMQQLFELQLRYEANEARKAFNGAMSDFRENAPTIARKRTGHNIKYAGLSESIEAIQPLLSEFGLSHQWKTRQEGNGITVECTITHRMGHSESTSLTAAPDTSGSKNTIQAIGSTVSYLERYTLYAILGLSSREMDDDGNGGRKQRPKPADDDEHVKALRACVSLEGLQAEWAAIPNAVRPKYTDIKDEVKSHLTTKEGK